MKLLDRMEKRFGRFSIHGLMRYVIACYIVGYVLYYTMPSSLSYLTLEPYMIFHYGQAWRLISWVLMPPSYTNIIFVVIMLILYYQLGTTLERTWGAFRFNVFIFGGIILSILGALVLYLLGLYGFHTLFFFGSSFSTFYINMSIFLAFAVAFPDMKIMLYFFIPIKMKWMGLVYAALMVYYFVVAGSLPGRIAIVASLANFLIYFLATRNFQRFAPKNVRRRRDFKQASQSPYGNPPSRTGTGRTGTRRTGAGSSGFGNTSPRNTGTGTSSSGNIGTGSTGAVPFHKCAICGRTELDDPNLQFRYCSKCNGNYEYCQDHLFTHTHVK